MIKFKLEDSTQVMDEFRKAFHSVAEKTIFDILGSQGIVQPRKCEHDEVLSVAVYKADTDCSVEANVEFYFVVRTNDWLNPFYTKVYPGPKAGSALSMEEMGLTDGLNYLMEKLAYLWPTAMPSPSNTIEFSGF